MISGTSGSGAFGGMDIETIVTALMNAQRGTINRAQSEIRGFQARRTAMDEIRSAFDALSSVRSKALGSASLRAQLATSSDEGRLTASASGAEAGVHDVEIQQLAQADRHRSQVVADRDSTPIAHGLLEFTVDGVQTSITVDDSNDTLSGVASAINAATGGARASIVNDGSGHVLVLSSKETGVAQAITFDTNTTDLAFTQTQAAKDAALSIDGVDVTSASNTVADALEGVTLELHAAEVGRTISLEIAPDAEKIQASIGDFVSAFNNALAVIDRATRVDMSGGRAGGPLAGDASMRSLRDSLLRSVSARVTPDDAGGFGLLAEVGITLGADARLQVDDGKLAAKIKTSPAGVAGLFLVSGRATDAAVRFVANTPATQAGTHAVQITAVAERATLVGDRQVDAGLAQDETLTILVGALSVDAALVAGDDAGTVVGKINAALSAAGADALATNDGGRIAIRTRAYGSAAELSVSSSIGNLDGSVGFDIGSRSDSGQDVAGTIGGEAATGSGQLLVGNEGSDVAGLRLLISATSAGAHGDVVLRVGVGERLERLLQQSTRSGTGRLAVASESTSKQISGRQDRIDRMESILEARADALRRKFTAAQQALAALEQMQASFGSQTEKK